MIDGLDAKDAARITEAQDFAASFYLGKKVATGQSALEFSHTLTLILASLKTDVETRLAGLLCEIPFISLNATNAINVTNATMDAQALETIELRFGKDVSGLIVGIAQLMRLRTFVVKHQEVKRSKNAAQQAQMQLETLRKMLLAMASDMRVVLIWLASCVATLRYFSQNKAQNEMAGIAVTYARETLDLYAPLANRLGIWQLKWELEDLSFRLIEPATYKQIAQLLEEKRVERLDWIARVMASLKSELATAEIKAEVSGRPKHIFSIWNKMRGKSLDFSDLYDILAFRIIVADVKTCYAALSVVHHIWEPIEREFDDYIARPKENGYQSLHTVVWAQDEFANRRALEVQIRTEDMHRFAEYGVAAHWRYKEAGGSNFSEQKYDEKIAWLRQLLAWKSDIADTVIGTEDQTKNDHPQWSEKLQSGMLDDRIFVLTPQARVIELPAGATAIDFAYHLHTDVGHRCRGARIDGVMVPLNTPLKNGQTLEIITAKGSSGMVGPSRDWLALGYTKSNRARSKIRAWFNAIEQQETLAYGRALVEKTLQREGKTAVNLETLAQKLGFARVEGLFLSVGKDEFSLRQVEQALHDTLFSKDDVSEKSEVDAFLLNRGRAPHPKQEAKSGVLVVGTDGLMTQLAKCCRPVPPDDIVGFVTRGKGVSIHRSNCKNIAEMRAHAGQRMIQTAWGQADLGAVYPVDIFVLANDRQGLLRDISEVFSREKINVVGVRTKGKKGLVSMFFIVEIAVTNQLQKVLHVLQEVSGVQQVRRQ